MLEILFSIVLILPQRETPDSGFIYRYGSNLIIDHLKRSLPLPGARRRSQVLPSAPGRPLPLPDTPRRSQTLPDAFPDAPGPVLEPSWNRLGTSRGCHGRPEGRLGDFLEGLEAVLGVLGEQEDGLDEEINGICALRVHVTRDIPSCRSCLNI